MKKITVVGLVLLFVVAGSLSVMAEDVSDNIVVKVNVLEYVEVLVPEVIELDVIVNEDTSASAEISLLSNCEVTVEVESDGFEEALLNQYITYSIEGYSYSLNPGFDVQSHTFNEPVTGNFTVNWNGEAGFEEADWYEVEAGSYSDTITYTISY